MADNYTTDTITHLLDGVNPSKGKEFHGLIEDILLHSGFEKSGEGTTSRKGKIFQRKSMYTRPSYGESTQPTLYLATYYRNKQTLVRGTNSLLWLIKSNKNLGVERPILTTGDLISKIREEVSKKQPLEIRLKQAGKNNRISFRKVSH